MKKSKQSFRILPKKSVSKTSGGNKNIVHALERNRFSAFMKKNIKLIIALIVGVLMGSVVVFGIYLLVSYDSVVVRPNSAPSASLKTNQSPTPTPTPDPDRDFGVLLLGYGGPGHDGGYLTDTIMVAYIQPRKEMITLISVPRDLWVPLSITEDQDKGFKVNAAYAIGRDDRRYPDKPIQYTGEAGGGEMAKDALSLVTGLNIEHFAALSFAGFVQSIDTLGGVNVRIPVTFEDPYYPIDGKQEDTCDIAEEDIATASAQLKGEKLEQFFHCRFEVLQFDAGVEQMDGTRALKFARSRHSPTYGGDYSRTQRQRAVILAAKDKILSVGFIPKIIPFISTLAANFQTDVDLDKLREMLDRSEELREYDITSIAISEQNTLQPSVSSDGQYILIPQSGEENWQSIHEFILNELQSQASTSAQTDQ